MVSVSNTRQLVAIVNIFLLLSVNPINAARIGGFRAVVEEVAGVEEAVRDLEEALREDQHEESRARQDAHVWEDAVAAEYHDSQVHDVVAEENQGIFKAENLCGKKWLEVGFVHEDRATTIRFKDWDNKQIFTKHLAPKSKGPACKKVYVGDCKKGGMRVETLCENKKTKTDLRGLSGFISSRDSDIHAGEKVDLSVHANKADHTFVLTRGTIDYRTLDIDEHQASCDYQQTTFASNIASVQKHMANHGGQDAGSMGFMDAVHVALNLRSASKAMKTAKQEQCEWLSQSDVVPKAPLQELVKENLAGNPCYEQAKEALTTESADIQGSNQNGIVDTPQEQLMAVRSSMEMLMTEKCDGGHNVVGEINSLDTEIDSEAAKLETLVDHQVSFLEMTGKERLDGQAKLGDAGEIFVKIFGFIILAILWALFCWVILAVVMAVLGVILCSLKAVIVALVNLFKKDKWEIAWTGCVGWWLSALGHSGTGDPGIALCAASMMINSR